MCSAHYRHQIPSAHTFMASWLRIIEYKPSGGIVSTVSPPRGETQTRQYSSRVIKMVSSSAQFGHQLLTARRAEAEAERKTITYEQFG